MFWRNSTKFIPLEGSWNETACMTIWLAVCREHTEGGHLPCIAAFRPSNLCHFNVEATERTTWEALREARACAQI